MSRSHNAEGVCRPAASAMGTVHYHSHDGTCRQRASQLQVNYVRTVDTDLTDQMGYCPDW